MAFDTTIATPPLPGSALDVRTEIQVNGAYVDISSYVFMDSTAIGRGHPDESTTASPSTFAATINNADGRFSQTNPRGPYYPYLGLNTPIRVSIPDASPHLRLELDSVSGAKTPNSATFNVSSWETWLDADLDNWLTPQILAAKWLSSGAQRSWMVTVTAGGYLQWLASVDGTATNTMVATSTAPVAQAHGRLSVRVAWNNSGRGVTFYTGSQCAGWVQLGSTVTASGSSTSVFASTSPLEVGVCAGNTDTTIPGANGKIYAFAMVNGAGSPPISAAVALTDYTTLTAGSTSWTDSAGNAWTREGTAYVDNRNYRFHGTVAAWPQSWTPQSANAQVALSAAGKLRQLSQGDVPSFSPMYRYFNSPAAATLAAYWPMEDGTGVSALSPAAGAYPMLWGGTSPTLAGNSTAFPGSAALPVLNSATLTGRVAYSGTWTANDIKLLLKVPAAGDNSATVANITTTGTLALLQLQYSNTAGGGFTLTAYNSAGTSLGGPAVFSTGYNGQSVAVQAALTVSGTTITIALSVITAGGVQTTATGAITGSIGAVTSIQVNPSFGGNLSSSVIGHVAISPVYTALATMAPEGVGFTPMNGWAGEPAGLRFARVCGEEGITFRGMGNLSDTSLMGVQGTDTPENILQSCADLDRGMWFEPRPVFGFGYRTRVSLGNQTPAVVFDYNQDHLADTLEPTHDDQTVKNDVTVTSNSSSATRRAILNDGSAMSVGVIGRYSVSINVNPAADPQLNDAAGWNLHVSTVNEPRYTAINVDLANSALVSRYYAILNVDAGDRVQIINPPIWVPPGSIDQLAQGFNEVLSLKDLTESWAGIPASPWNYFVADDTVYGRADTDGSTLAASASAALGSGIPDAYATGWFAYNGANVIVAPPVQAPNVPQCSWIQWTSNGGSYGHESSPAVPITPSSTYILSGYLYCPVTTTVGVGVQSVTSANGYISDTQLTSVTCPAGTVVPFVAGPFTAPATAAYGLPCMYIGATPTNGEQVLMTALALTPGASTASLSVATSNANSPLWTTTTADFPFDILIAGERMTVTAITGTTSPQAFTVVRSANGVVNAPASGADVRLFIPPILSM